MLTATRRWPSLRGRSNVEIRRASTVITKRKRDDTRGALTISWRDTSNVAFIPVYEMFARLPRQFRDLHLRSMPSRVLASHLGAIPCYSPESPHQACLPCVVVQTAPLLTNLARRTCDRGGPAHFTVVPNFVARGHRNRNRSRRQMSGIYTLYLTKPIVAPKLSDQVQF